jgi:rhodanese-related sulfurtransferase
VSERTVDSETLRSWMADGKVLWLIHGSGSGSFRGAHLPGAICLADLGQARAALGADERIVVYGDDLACSTTRRWRTALTDMGYTDVWWYAAGMTQWRRIGGPVEGTNAREAPPGASLGACF